MVETERPQPIEPSFDLMRFMPEVDRAVGELLHTDAKIFIATTGAGAGITQLIWRTPGISRILIGTSFPYHRKEFQKFIGREFEGPYVSETAAVALALASYERVLSAEDSLTNLPIGIGLTAAVATLNQPSESRVIIAARTPDKTEIVSVSMEKNYLDRVGEGGVNDLLTLNMILHAAGVKQIPLPDLHLTSQEIINQNGELILNPKQL
ncbi:MAG: hypothetical protein HYU48_00500 [Candidatus Levybacteria bacterium]|nr:hypothetical protein [Candidatus Levybacteria bacterium]